MDKKNHFKKQIEYFNKEFFLDQKYSISEWQKSYIEKIKKNVLSNDFKKKVLLDIGTGSGYVAIELAKLKIKVIACDLSSQSIKNLEMYKRKYKVKNLRTIVCNAEKLPIKTSTVDYIISNALLEHLPNEEKAIAEWKRVLKKGGKMMIVVPISLKYVWPFFWLINIFYDKKLGHLRRYDEETLKNKFKLKIIKTSYTGHFVKVIGVLLSLLFNTSKFDKFLENFDKKEENIKYGSNNICVVFVK